MYKDEVVEVYFYIPKVYHGIFEEIGRHAKGGRSQECSNSWVVEFGEHVLFECASYNFSIKKF